jgi:2-phospho-L-lactate guanylyltransferase
VPIKSFVDAKERLAPVLDPEQRRSLAMQMAAGVLEATKPSSTAVVCDDEEVAAWAAARGATIIWAPGRGLNGAVATGVQELSAQGFDRITVVHADLPFPEGLLDLPAVTGVLLVPDRRHDGTNVLGIPARSDFTFSYGRASFARHLAAAKQLGRGVEVLEDLELSIDVDLPEDLEEMRTRARRRGPEGPRSSTSS